MNSGDLETLTVERAAEILGVRPETVRIWVREGRLEAMRWGGRLRFRPEAVAAFQAASTVHIESPRERLRRSRRPGARHVSP